MFPRFHCIRFGLLLLAAVAPAACNAPERVITRPDWVSKPTGEDMARLYPKRAEEEGVPGKAMITCLVTVGGTLESCKLLNETPGGYGFGEAALALAPSFRMSPKKVDGEAVAGGRVMIPLVFKIPDDKPSLGEMASILTPVGPNGPSNAKAEILPCPDGRGDCEAHPLVWLAKPDATETSRILQPIKPEDAATYAACTVDTIGDLQGCTLVGPTTPATRTAALTAIGRLKAPSKSVDGTPTAGKTVLVGFLWDWLKLGSKEMAKRRPQRDDGDGSR